MIMKYKKIKLEDNKSVLVDESAKGKIGYCFNISLSKIDKLSRDYETGTFEEMYTYKIIATINHSISLDVPMIIMEDEVEKSAYKVFPKDILETSKNCFDDMNSADRYNWINGYKAAQQKGVYSEEVIISNFQEKYYEFINSGGLNGSSSEWIDHSKLVPWFKNYIQSLKQEYIELEMEAECCKKYTSCNTNCRYDNETVWKIKTNRVDGQLMAYVK